MKISHAFANPQLLEQALTHRSYAHERGQDNHNERLELLGDSVLNVALTHLLMQAEPQAREGDLSKRRALLVNESALAKIAQGLELGSLIRLGKGEMASGGSTKPRLLASTLEAVVGALFLDGGYEVAAELVREWYRDWREVLSDESVIDAKSHLQELLQSVDRQLPVYEVIDEEGPAHDRWFRVQVKIGGRVLATGEGKSKKIAEQQAARLALEAYSK